MATESTTHNPLFNPLLPWQWAAAAWQQWFQLAATMVPGVPGQPRAIGQRALDSTMLAQAMAPRMTDDTDTTPRAGRSRDEAPVAAEQAAGNAKAPRRRSSRAKTGTRRQTASSKPRAHRGTR
jgi:hypothetical protein